MLFDTTFLIDFEREAKRNRPGPAHAFLSKNPNIPLYISLTTVGEFAEGFTAEQEEDCWSCLQYYSVLNTDNAVAWRAGQIARHLRANRAIIGDNDVWIAATALCHSLPLVTKNTKHFERVPGLKLATY